MSVNLIDLVMKQVGGNVPGILGSLLGENAERTQGAVAGAVPAILGGLMGAVSKGGDGADRLAAVIGQQDDSLLDNLAGAFGGGQHTKLAEQGGSMLTSLLGDGVIGSLVGAIGKFSGLGSGSSKSLLGMLAPIVMSVLGRQQREQGLDGGGLVNLLMGQKDHIQSAMPEGMASALGGANFLDGLMGSATASIGDAVDAATDAVGDAASGAASAVGAAAQGATDAAASVASSAAGAAADAAGAAADAAGAAAAAAGQGVGAASEAAQNVASGASQAASDASAAVTGAAESGGSWMRWLLPLLILLALIWLGFKFLGGGDVEEAVSDASDAASSAVEATTEAASEAVDAATDAAGDAADAASSAVETMTAMVGDIDVGGGLTSTFDGLTETLSGITDTASAEAALPALEELSTGLDSLTGLADQLPEGAVGGITDMVTSGLSGLDDLMANLESMPGVGDLIKPIIDQIRDKLAAFTAA
ncbi:MAG: DUF937 domain-containing protein [Alphaproteobacteria bacterium]|nr:DUF937 domain-containing protein [Alphaproteobacteria bacterium]